MRDINQGEAFDTMIHMVDATTKAPLAGLTLTVTISKNCGAYGSPGTAPTVTDRSNGEYKLAFANVADTDTVGVLSIRATATGADASIVRHNVLTPVYSARLWMVDDNGGTTDRYTLAFYRNGAVVTTGITSPKLTVVNASNTDIFTDKVPTAVGSTGFYSTTATSGERQVSGVAYMASLRATIDGAERTFVLQPQGRDST